MDQIMGSTVYDLDVMKTTTTVTATVRVTSAFESVEVLPMSPAAEENGSPGQTQTEVIPITTSSISPGLSLSILG